VAFRSPKFLDRDDTVYRQLLTLKAFTSDETSTELRLEQKGHHITVQGNRVCLKLSEDDNGQLSLYFPQDARIRASCYRSQLPKLIQRFLGIADLAAEFGIHLVLDADADCLGDVLAENDIPSVSWIAVDEQYRSGTSHGNGDEDADVLTTPSTGDSSGKDDGDIVGLRPADVVLDLIKEEDIYRQLLDTVVKRARSEGKNQSAGAGNWNLQALADALPEERPTDTAPPDLIPAFITYSVAHNNKIGAAGELYVRVLPYSLSTLSFPSPCSKRIRIGN
jgi:hypothetical protein